jgi:hypothetical protein
MAQVLQELNRTPMSANSTLEEWTKLGKFIDIVGYQDPELFGRPSLRTSLKSESENFGL